MRSKAVVDIHPGVKIRGTGQMVVFLHIDDAIPSTDHHLAQDRIRLVLAFCALKAVG